MLNALGTFTCLLAPATLLVLAPRGSVLDDPLACESTCAAVEDPITEMNGPPHPQISITIIGQNATSGTGQLLGTETGALCVTCTKCVQLVEITISTPPTLGVRLDVNGTNTSLIRGVSQTTAVISSTCDLFAFVEAKELTGEANPADEYVVQHILNCRSCDQ